MCGNFFRHVFARTRHSLFIQVLYNFGGFNPAFTRAGIRQNGPEIILFKWELAEVELAKQCWRGGRCDKLKRRFMRKWDVMQQSTVIRLDFWPDFWPYASFLIQSVMLDVQGIYSIHITSQYWYFTILQKHICVRFGKTSHFQTFRCKTSDFWSVLWTPHSQFMQFVQM